MEPVMVVESSFSGFLRMLFWFFVISFLLRLVMRMYFSTRYNRQSADHRREGEVTVEQKKKTRTLADEGEYVDFIEIKDDKK
jgi:uncharacterized protein (UPF0332 family)